MKKLSLVLWFIVYAVTAAAQSPTNTSSPLRGSALDSIKYSLSMGSKDALYHAAIYLDSSRTLTEYLGYHILQTPERVIAARLIDENCTFLKNEIVLTPKSTTAEFVAFLNQSFDKIKFDWDTHAFLITPLTARQARFVIRGTSLNSRAELKAKAPALLATPWVKREGIDQLYKNRNPLCLYKIAALFYQERNRFNYYNQRGEDYTDLLELLTGTEIGVEDDTQKIDYHINANYYDKPRLNLLIYLANNYYNYQWDNTTGFFVNANIQPKEPSNELIYFQQLSSKTDSVAMHAFIKITTCDPARVDALANEFERAGTDPNDVVPMFPYKFLRQISLLTAYCKVHHIDFTGSKQLRHDIAVLRKTIPFTTRRKLENKLIANLTPSSITAFEYWSLIYEQGFEFTYSAGRILDVFYSNNWDSIVKNKKQLDIYLKKSFLYNNLGIIGICNNYLKKFAGSSPASLQILKKNISADSNITFQTKAAIKIAVKKQSGLKTIKKTNDGNFSATPIANLPKAYSTIIANNKDAEKRDDKMWNLISRINYSQIGNLCKLLKSYRFKADYADKYNFLDSDFGFTLNDFSNNKTVDNFLAYYFTHTEQMVYAHYLAVERIDYQHADHSYNYDKIYDILKYNVVSAFVGGGGGTRDNEVYAVIKMLELKFNTTLGFPAKLCNSANVYGCNSDDRAKFWMVYLKDKKLLKLPHNTPQSFGY